LVLPFTPYIAWAKLGGPAGAPLQMVSSGAHSLNVLSTYDGPIVMGGAPPPLKNSGDGSPIRTTAAT
jgi:hypothetical protein